MNVSDCIVVGLGGNALNRRDEPFTLQRQRERLAAAAAALIPSLAGSPAVITHGNGPQIGALALRASFDVASDGALDEPLDVLGAESDAMIGYELELALRSMAPGREIVMVLTATEVDPRDSAFSEPTKPIGPLCSADVARRLADEHGWIVAPQPAGDTNCETVRWRRVVPSPEPVCIVELGAIARLVDAGVTVICAGGGGVPVMRGSDGKLHGVEAVVDKDLASALLAVGVRARQLVLLTDVPGVMHDFGTSHATVIEHLSVGEARSLTLPSGSMGPKVEACCRFVEATGRPATIGALDDVGDVLAGRSGTRIDRCASSEP